MNVFPAEMTKRAAHSNVIAAVCVCFLLFSPLSIAVAQYHIDSWTTQNGLPSNWIVGITQTHDGYLWLTTLDGVARFDGVRFRIFNKFNTPALTSNRFSYHAVWEDRSGNLWMGTEGGGLVRYRDDVFTTFTTKDGLPGNDVFRIDEDDSGTLWIITDGGVATW